MNKVPEWTGKTIDVCSETKAPGCSGMEARQPDDFAIEGAIKREIERNGARAFYFSDVTCNCSGGKVRVCGRVPTDRLKQALWSLILSLDGVTGIDDHLDVVSSTGLSSIRPRQVCTHGAILNAAKDTG